MKTFRFTYALIIAKKISPPFFLFLAAPVFITKNMPGDKPLAFEKLCSELFCTSRLKITMKHHKACYMCQDYTNDSCLCAALCRLHLTALENKTLRACSEKKKLFLKKI